MDTLCGSSKRCSLSQSLLDGNPGSRHDCGGFTDDVKAVSLSFLHFTVIMEIHGYNMEYRWKYVIEIGMGTFQDDCSKELNLSKIHSREQREASGEKRR